MSTEAAPNDQSARQAQQSAKARSTRQILIIVLGVLIVGGGAYGAYSRRAVSAQADQAAAKLRSIGFDVNFAQAEGADSPIPFLQQVGRKMRIQMNPGQGQISPESIDLIKTIDEDMHIVFDGCKEFKDEHLRQLKDKKNIRWLNLGGTQITDTSVATINEFHLEQLEIPATGLTDAGITQLSPQALSRLTDVSFAHTKIGDEGMKHLAGAPHLKQLDMTGTDATPGAKTTLRSRRPNVLIIGGKTAEAAPADSKKVDAGKQAEDAKKPAGGPKAPEKQAEKPKSADKDKK